MTSDDFETSFNTADDLPDGRAKIAANYLSKFTVIFTTCTTYDGEYNTTHKSFLKSINLFACQTQWRSMKCHSTFLPFFFNERLTCCGVVSLQTFFFFLILITLLNFSAHANFDYVLPRANGFILRWVGDRVLC